MERFNVIVHNFNSNEFEAYDVIPYLVDKYKSAKDKPETFDEFKKFIKGWAMNQWWSRCEYEIILSSWPPNEKSERKWDVYMQVMLNLDVITKIVMKSINE